MGLISEGEIRGRLAELDNKITNSEMATTILKAKRDVLLEVLQESRRQG